MRTLLIAGLTLLLTGLAVNAMADRGNRYGGQNDRYDRGDRINQRLDARGDRVERRFDHRADRAADRGNYRQAYRLKEKGERINRRLDRRGDRFEARYDHRPRYSSRYYNHRAFRAAPRYPLYGGQFGLGIYVPGFWFSGVWHD